jgi:hypothetical protein
MGYMYASPGFFERGNTVNSDLLYDAKPNRTEMHVSHATLCYPTIRYHQSHI